MIGDLGLAGAEGVLADDSANVAGSGDLLEDCLIERDHRLAR